jgi:inorganic pyrophosphatase
VTFGGWGDANEAKRLITEAIDRAKNQRARQR